MFSLLIFLFLDFTEHLIPKNRILLEFYNSDHFFGKKDPSSNDEDMKNINHSKERFIFKFNRFTLFLKAK